MAHLGYVFAISAHFGIYPIWVFRSTICRFVAIFVRLQKLIYLAPGYLIKPVEILFGKKQSNELGGLSRFQGALCWKMIINQFVKNNVSLLSYITVFFFHVSLQDWISQEKTLKLLLKCIFHIIDTEKCDSQTVQEMGDSLVILIENAW